MTKKILITGGLGFLGSNLALFLLNNGYKVTIFDNKYRGNIEKLRKQHKKFKIFIGDIRKYNQLNKACKNIDTVFHLAYINGTENFYNNPELVLDVGIQGTLNILACIVYS